MPAGAVGEQELAEVPVTVDSDYLQRKDRMLLYLTPSRRPSFVDLLKVAGKFFPARIVYIAILAC